MTEYNDKLIIHNELCKSMHILYAKKNADYGDSFAQMRNRYPNVIGMKLWEKVNRLCNLLDSQTQEVKDESVEDTLMDIANYAIMELTERKLNDGLKYDTVGATSALYEQIKIEEGT